MKKLLCCLLCIFLLGAAASAVSASEDTAASFSYSILEASGEAIVEGETTRADLDALKQACIRYTTVTADGDNTAVWRNGVTVSDYFISLGIDPEEVSSIRFEDIDGGTMTFTRQALYAVKRYTFTPEDVPSTATETPPPVQEASPPVEETPATQSGPPGTETPPTQTWQQTQWEVQISTAAYDGAVWDETQAQPCLTVSAGQTDPGTPAPALGTLRRVEIQLAEGHTFTPAVTQFAFSIRVGTELVETRTISMTELLAMPRTQAVYSSLTLDATAEKILVSGIPIMDLIDYLGVAYDDVSNLRFFFTDGKDSSFSRVFLLDQTRYYYPDADSTVNRAEVPALLALQYHIQPLSETDAWDALSDDFGIRVCYGQLKPADVCSTMYGYNICKMELVLSSASTYAKDSGETTRSTVYDPALTDTSGPATDPNTGYQLAQLPEALAVTVRYFGTEAMPRKTFTLQELRTLPLVRQPYTAVDAAGQIVLETAVGVRLTDIIAAAGVDAGSIQTVTFHYTDETGARQGLTFKYTDLTDTPRFFYPYLPTRWDSRTGRPAAGAAAGAVAVDTIIAFRENYAPGATAPDYYRLSSDGRFRLVFGQTNTRTPTAAQLVKWIDTIDILLYGAPPEDGTDSADADLIGSAAREDAPMVQQPTQNTPDANAAPNTIEADPNAGGTTRWRLYEITPNAVPAEPPARQGNSVVLALAAVCTLFAGAGERIFLFRKGQQR